MALQSATLSTEHEPLDAQHAPLAGGQGIAGGQVEPPPTVPAQLPPTGMTVHEPSARQQVVG